LVNPKLGYNTWLPPTPLFCRGHNLQMVATPSSSQTILLCCSFCRKNCLSPPHSHSPSHLSQVNKHQLSILANADEAVSPKPRSFRLCWWLKLLSLPTCSCCRCFDIASQCIYISHHVCFHEHVFPFYNSEQIAKVSTTPPALTATVLLLNMLHSPLFPPIQLCHHNQPTRHNLHPSLAHHHMHVYLTILLQVQLVN